MWWSLKFELISTWSEFHPLINLLSHPLLFFDAPFVQCYNLFTLFFIGIFDYCSLSCWSVSVYLELSELLPSPQSCDFLQMSLNTIKTTLDFFHHSMFDFNLRTVLHPLHVDPPRAFEFFSFDPQPEVRINGSWYRRF